MVVMMALAWRTISNTSDSAAHVRAVRGAQPRAAHGDGARRRRLRGRVPVARTRTSTPSHPRTMLIAKSGRKMPDIRFSTLGHRVLWADANESEQTVIQYLAHNDPEHAGVVDWIRREQRRAVEPAARGGAVRVRRARPRHRRASKIEFWNWKNVEWQDTWDTTQSRRPARLAAEPRADHADRQGPRRQGHQAVDPGTDLDAGSAELLPMSHAPLTPRDETPPPARRRARRP